MNGEPWLSVHIRCCVWRAWASGSHCGVMGREPILRYVRISASFLLSQPLSDEGTPLMSYPRSRNFTTKETVGASPFSV